MTSKIFLLKGIAFVLLTLLPALSRAQTFTEQTRITGISDGLSWGDYDNDGDLDILSATKIYKNNGDNTFTELAGVSLTGLSGSVAWGDYDNDGDLDILNVFKIYINNGNNTFTGQACLSLTGIVSNCSSWGDYDNDGDLDILFAANTSSNPITKIYRNDGSNTFTLQAGISLTGVDGTVAWGDYDNDGDLDILLTGYAGTLRFGKIYRNNGNNTFTDITSVVIAKVDVGRLAWGDYDNDGDLDILLTGFTNANPICVSKIYRNDGNNVFTVQSGITLTGVYDGSVAWGDYNNDGFLDILLAGTSISGSVSKVYSNNGNNTFTEQTDIVLAGISSGVSVWGDYDNDGDLDILLTGSGFTKIYRNNTVTANTAPSTPLNLQTSIVNGTSICFKWDKATDTQTTQNGLAYNLYLYEEGQTNYKRSPNAFKPTHINNGRRLIAQIGNIQYSTAGYIMKGLPNGNYKWSVQAVDAGFKGSGFAAEQSVYFYNLGQVGVDIPGELITNTKAEMDFSINSSNGINGDWTPCTEPNTYVDYGLGGFEVWVRLRSKPANNREVAKIPCKAFTLQAGISMKGAAFSGAEWGDYDNDGDLDIIVCGYDGVTNFAKVYRNNGDNSFTEQTDISFSGIAASVAKWVDYDRDGDFDINIVGAIGSVLVSRIYRNDGNNLFVEQIGISMVGLNSSVDWGDYDNDGYPDLLMTGSYEIKLYHNNGDNTFTLQSNSSLPGVHYSAADWGDFDNDGYIDILIAGDDEYGDYTTSVYRNNGNKTFTKQAGISLVGIGIGSLAWGDYDNDGDLDIILSGITDDQSFAKVYRNNGDKTFTEQTGIVIAAAIYSSLAWGDYDNDGDLDIIITGRGSEFPMIYRNNGDNSFIALTGIGIVGVELGSVSWADYDNDGDLDILLSGSEGSYTSTHTLVTKIYLNNIVAGTAKTANEAASAPSNLNTTSTGGNVTLFWDKATDTETPQKNLTYNLYVYQDGQNKFVRVPNAFTQTQVNNGKRLMSQMGSIQYSSTGYTLKNLKTGNYKWSVQAIDGALKGGLFAVENTFSIVNVADVGYHLANGVLTRTMADMEYSFNSTNGSDGNWTVCADIETKVDFGVGGFDIWMRQKSIPANNQKVGSVLQQGIAPVYTIDYMNETTGQIIADNTEYSINADMSSAIVGNRVKIAVVPGHNLYFRFKGSATILPSAIQALIVPAQPIAPIYTIDYIEEKTAEVVPATDESSTSNSMLYTSYGSGLKIIIIPGQSIHFRRKATSTSFKSLIQSLIIPIRPATPTNPIVSDMNNTFDWTNSASFPNATDYEYTTNGGTNWTPCTVKPINVGNGYIYFYNIIVRVKATTSNFRSLGLQANNNFTSITKTFEDFGIRCFPNPVKEKLVLENIPEKGLIEIYSANGMLMRSANVEQGINQIDFTELPKGVYLILLQFNDTRVQSRVVK